MAVTIFKDASYNLSGLIAKIGYGEIALPDIQRPFVWSSAKVRDLFDSMYKGFPVGYLLFWATGADPTAKQIGTETPQSAPDLLIVDGQQRLTSLYSVLTGKAVVDKDYREFRIRIAFRPADQTIRGRRRGDPQRSRVHPGHLRGLQGQLLVVRHRLPQQPGTAPW